MKRQEFLAHLNACGCVLVREGAKHSWWGNPQSGHRSAVPRHTEISNVLARKICRDLGIQEKAK